MKTKELQTEQPEWRNQLLAVVNSVEPTPIKGTKGSSLNVHVDGIHQSLPGKRS